MPSPRQTAILPLTLLCGYLSNAAATDLSIGAQQPKTDLSLPYTCAPMSDGSYYCTSQLQPLSPKQQMGDDQQEPSRDSSPEISLKLDSRSQWQRLSDKTGTTLGELSSIVKFRLNPDGSLDTLTLGSGATSIKLDGATLKDVKERGVIDPENANVKLRLTIKIPGM